MNGAQKTNVAAGLLVLLCPTLFPPWQQAQLGEPTEYRKNLFRCSGIARDA
jgi:hypothetical protein